MIIGGIVNNMSLGCVSIIVPVYNTECHIEKCLKSIVNQTYKNIEVDILP